MSEGRALLDHFLDLLFPPRCSGCRTRGVLLCADCLERCRSLRAASPLELARHRQHGALTTVVGLYHFDTPLREAIHVFKYKPRRALGDPLAALLVAALPSYLHTCDVVAPVPLHAARLRERGFNQSALLAAAVAQALHKPMTDKLTRIRATPHQVGLDRRGRESNVRGAFAWHGRAAPSAVVLVDDILTTGATLRECARALRDAGVREIHAVALATGGDGHHRDTETRRF